MLPREMHDVMKMHKTLVKVTKSGKERLCNESDNQAEER